MLSIVRDFEQRTGLETSKLSSEDMEDHTTYTSWAYFDEITGLVLEQRRTNRGISAQELIKLSGKSPSWVYRIECGQYPTPLSYILWFCQIADMPPKNIFEQISDLCKALDGDHVKVIFGPADAEGSQVTRDQLKVYFRKS